MTTIRTNVKGARPAAFTEVLQAPRGGADIGFRLVGEDTGRAYLISGQGPVVKMVFDFLAALPLLSCLQGQLFLLRIDALDRIDQATPIFPTQRRFEDFMFLPYAQDMANLANINLQACRATMRFCIRGGLLPETRPAH